MSFAQVPAFDRGCPYVDSTNVYRFVNTIYNYDNINKRRKPSLLLDMVPFAPSHIYGDHYGYGFLLGSSPDDPEYTLKMMDTGTGGGSGSVGLEKSPYISAPLPTADLFLLNYETPWKSCRPPTHHETSPVRSL